MNMIAPYQIQALNDAEASENKMHSDDIAQKYGFTSALVSGVSVFGYLTHPLVETYGEGWLSNSMADVIFIKPAYHEEMLAISTENVQDSQYQHHHITTAYNEAGVLLSRLESWRPDELPPIDERAYVEPRSINPPRTEITWDRIIIDEPVTAYSWQPTAKDNQKFLDRLRDRLPIYRKGDSPLIHPFYMLSTCNQALVRMFILPAWIHTGSRIIFRQPLRIGQTIDVRTIPIEKWERKGHQFVKLYIAMRADDEIAVEVEHTAIFRIAPKA
ncbi:MAG: hypothetical protein AAF512_00460 [Pseudomonadota bacterium]